MFDRFLAEVISISLRILLPPLMKPARYLCERLGNWIRRGERADARRLFNDVLGAIANHPVYGSIIDSVDEIVDVVFDGSLAAGSPQVDRLASRKLRVRIRSMALEDKRRAVVAVVSEVEYCDVVADTIEDRAMETAWPWVLIRSVLQDITELDELLGPQARRYYRSVTTSTSRRVIDAVEDAARRLAYFGGASHESPTQHLLVVRHSLAVAALSGRQGRK